MTYTTLNSNGSPVQGWEAAEPGETELQRTRRRYQQRRCVACGDPQRYGKKALCAACWEAGRRYCARCERIVDLAAWHASFKCRACQAAYDRDRPRPAPVPREVQQRANAARHAQAQARMAEMGRLRDRGWTWAEIGRRFGLSAASAEDAYQRNRRKARAQKGAA